MNDLSASATIILKYAKEHANKDNVVDLQNYSDLPENITVNACKELLKRGLISDIGYSELSVEYIILK